MKINNLIHIKKSKIRIFPFQTRDGAFILFPDLPSSYLLNLLIDKIGFKLSQFTFDYVYPTKKYMNNLLNNINDYEEDYFIFYLENYFHSSDYAFGFIIKVLEKLSLKEKPPLIIIHTIKTPKDNIKKLIERFDFISLIVNGDFEDFFYEFFIEKKDINDIGNIYFRDDDKNIYINNNKNANSDLNNYIFPAYSSGYYNNFPKNKDSIISIIDDDNEFTDENIYYRWPKEKFVKSFRYLPETSIMLTTGRGCKYKCSYCYRGAKYSTVRQISLETIKKDLDYLSELKYEYIYFYDDCFITTNFNRMDEIVDLFSQYDFEYGISSRFEVCTSENLLKLSKLNIKRIQVGLQSISLEVNKDTKRGFQKEKFEDTVKKMSDLGINLSLDLILGLPGEGLKGFIKTFNYSLTLKPYSIFINSLFLNPGTELYDKQEEYGIITNNYGKKTGLFHVEGIRSSNTFSEKDILIARKYVGFYMNKIKDIKIILR